VALDPDEFYANAIAAANAEQHLPLAWNDVPGCLAFES
jgi:hypothetical protein